MGCILGVCAAQAACCCCSAGCHLCCTCCPSSVSSVMTRLMYLFMIILGILLASAFIIPEVKESLSKKSWIPFYDKSACDILKVGEKCEDLVGFQSVYRVWFAFVMFFLLLALITIGVKSSKDCRAGFHNGFWLWKFLTLIGTMVGAFYIPSDPFNEVWMYIGLVGGILFIFIQVVYLIDFSHNWTESWLHNEDNACYKIGFIVCSAIMYGLAIAGVVGMFVLFTTSDRCNLNKGLISVNLILCIMASVIALLPNVQKANPSSGLLQASMVSMYVTYLTFSALSSEPLGSSDSSMYCNKNLSTISGGGNSMLIVGIIIAVLTIFCVSLKSSASDTSTGTVTDEEAPVQKVSNDEEDNVQYDYWLFHLLCLLGSLYLMMVMTNWLRPESANNIMIFNANWPSVWVQIVASWLCLALYMWTLIAPLVCRNRTFSWVGTSE